MKRFTPAPRPRIATRSIFLLAACLLWHSAHAQQGITPNAWFYEIDADYGSQLVSRLVEEEVDGKVEVREELDVSDGGVKTQGAREGSCDHWGHTTRRPYMGSRAYTVQCLFAPGQKAIRGEQHFVQGLRPGADSKRSVSMAVRLIAPPIPTKAGNAWIAQLHNENKTIPFILDWLAVPATNDEGLQPGYYLRAGSRYELPEPGGRPDVVLRRVTPNTWIRLLIQLDLGKGDNPDCPGSTTDDATWSVQIMDNATGLWGEPVPSPGQVGNRYNRTTCPAAEHFNTNFKVGLYAVLFAQRVDYDNISYGKRWANITKNHLIGYKKSVLRLPFEEASGSGVQDGSYTWNGGRYRDPLYDYDNDGTIVGEVTRIDNGLFGRALHFPGKQGDNDRGGYVNVPIRTGVVDDFDVGNYMTVSAWFRTRDKPDQNKGLVMIDEFSDRWKLLLYMRGNGIAFGVRHPATGAPVYSRLDYEFTDGRYADGQWHQVTATFNRFARRIATPANPARGPQRIKLYIDGRKVMEREGHDLPILRGENQLVVGKYSTDGFFKGDIDDVGLFNFTMTDREVEELWRRRGALERLQ